MDIDDVLNKYLNNMLNEQFKIFEYTFLNWNDISHIIKNKEFSVCLLVDNFYD